MIIVLPEPADIAAYGVLVVVLLIVFGIVLPAGLSRYPERRCASAAVLDQLLHTIRSVASAVAILFATSVLPGTGRPAM